MKKSNTKGPLKPATIAPARSRKSDKLLGYYIYIEGCGYLHEDGVIRSLKDAKVCRNKDAAKAFAKEHGYDAKL